MSMEGLRHGHCRLHLFPSIHARGTSSVELDPSASSFPPPLHPVIPAEAGTQVTSQGHAPRAHGDVAIHSPHRVIRPLHPVIPATLPHRHSREGGNPSHLAGAYLAPAWARSDPQFASNDRRLAWVPAFAGMTLSVGCRSGAGMTLRIGARGRKLVGCNSEAYCTVANSTSPMELGARVESRSGAVAGSIDHAPFPLPAHRTGRADFPHPALRLASRQGPRRRGWVRRTTPSFPCTTARENWRVPRPGALWRRARKRRTRSWTWRSIPV